jgi:citrate lyase subunit beta/citryl-CoA lyase
LFAPGSDAHKLDRVGDFGADAVVLDLEDAVAAKEKVPARDLVRAAIPHVKAKSQVVLVRVNGRETGLMPDDIAAAVGPGLDGLLIPKVQDKQTVDEADQLVTKAEQAAGLPHESVRLFVMIETALGLSRCEDIFCDAPRRLEKIVFGSGDFTVDLGVSFTSEGDEILYARSRLVVASRAAGLGSPLDGPYLHIKDDEGLRADTRRSRTLGFMGRVVVYPGQLDAVHTEYSWLTPTEVTRYRKIVDAFEAAEASGSAALRVDGDFVDYPIYYQARERLRQHDQLGLEGDANNVTKVQ